MTWSEWGLDRSFVLKKKLQIHILCESSSLTLSNTGEVRKHIFFDDVKYNSWNSTTNLTLKKKHRWKKKCLNHFYIIYIIHIYIEGPSSWSEETLGKRSNFLRLPASNQAAQSGRASRIKNRACHTWSVQVSKQSGSYECTNTPPLVTQTEARPVLPNIVNWFGVEVN